MSTQPSIVTSLARGTSTGLLATRILTPHIASNSPNAPPIVKSNKLSVSN